VLFETNGDCPGKDEDHGRPYGGRQVRVNSIDPNFGENCRRSCKDRRKKSPAKPSHSLELCRLNVDVHPLTLLDLSTNLGGRPTLLRLLVREQCLLHASGAFSPMQTFKTRVEAVVTHRFVASAVARLLMKNTGDLGGHFEDCNFVWLSEIGAGKLLTVKHCRQRCRRRAHVVSRNVCRGVAPLSRRCDRCNGDGQATEKLSHAQSLPVSSASYFSAFTWEQKRRHEHCCSCREASDATCVSTVRRLRNFRVLSITLIDADYHQSGEKIYF